MIKNRQIFIICLFFLLHSIFPHSLLFSQDNAQALIQRARDMDLANDGYWHILLHYRKSLFDFSSNIDKKEFFLSPSGKTDPQAELEATIQAFYNGEQIDIFPARYKWLSKKLALQGQDVFPSEKDLGYQNLKAQVNPTAAFLVFPSGYMKNPASMFGHTFLLFENQNRTRLSGQAVTYAARNTDNPGFIYALKGLFGLYYGDYFADMYSKEILKYSDIDLRDIWEYKLILTPDQLDDLFRHTVELTNVYSRYYYVSQNCTYNLMTLLDCAYPDAGISEALGMVAEPLKSVKILYQKGLVQEPDYRPSLHNVIQQERNLLGNNLAGAVNDYCFGKISLQELTQMTDSQEQLSLMYKLGSDYLKYALSSGLIELNEYRDRIMALFTATSKIKNQVSPVFTSQDYLHLSHDSKKIAISTGLLEKDPFVELYFRFVNHDLIDDDTGLNKNTNLTFFSGKASYFFQKNIIQLENFDFVNILSLPVSDSFFSAKAIDVVASIQRTQISESDDSLAFRFKFFAGKSFKVAEPNQFYVLAGLDSYINTNYKYGVDLLPGAEAGFLTVLGPWKQQIYGSVEQGVFKDGFVTKQAFLDRIRLRFNLSLEERLKLSRNTALSAKYSYGGDYKTCKSNLSLTLHLCF